MDLDDGVIGESVTPPGPPGDRPDPLDAEELEFVRRVAGDDSCRYEMGGRFQGCVLALVVEVSRLTRENAGLRDSLHNVLLLAIRDRKNWKPENCQHLIRFCREAGVEPNILRGAVGPRVEHGRENQ